MYSNTTYSNTVSKNHVNNMLILSQIIYLIKKNVDQSFLSTIMNNINNYEQYQQYQQHQQL